MTKPKASIEMSTSATTSPESPMRTGFALVWRVAVFLGLMLLTAAILRWHRQMPASQTPIDMTKVHGDFLNATPPLDFKTVPTPSHTTSGNPAPQNNTPPVNPTNGNPPPTPTNTNPGATASAPLKGNNPGALPDLTTLDFIDDYRKVTFDLLSSFTCEIPYPDETPDFDAVAKKITAAFPKDVLALNDTKAAVKGFVIPLAYEKEKLKVFILVRSQMMCCFGQTPKQNEWLLITMDEGKAVTPIIDKPVTVLGTLSVGVLLENNEVLSVYRIRGDEVRLIP